MQIAFGLEPCGIMEYCYCYDHLQSSPSNIVGCVIFEKFDVEKVKT